MLLHESDLHWVGPQALKDFCNIFLPNTDETQKKSSMSAEPLALCRMLNPLLVFALLSYNYKITVEGWKHNSLFRLKGSSGAIVILFEKHYVHIKVTWVSNFQDNNP